MVQVLLEYGVDVDASNNHAIVAIYFIRLCIMRGLLQ